MEELSGQLAALTGTLLLELLVAAMLAPPRIRGQVLAAVAAVNLITHPVASILHAGGPGSWIALEAGVLLTEAALLLWSTALTPGRGWALALAANAATALMAVGLHLGGLRLPLG